MTERHDHDVNDVYGAAKEHHSHRDYATGVQLAQTSARLAHLSKVAADLSEFATGLLEQVTGRVLELERDRAAIVSRMRRLEDALSLAGPDELEGQGQPRTSTTETTCPGGC